MLHNLIGVIAAEWRVAVGTAEAFGSRVAAVNTAPLQKNLHSLQQTFAVPLLVLCEQPVQHVCLLVLAHRVDFLHLVLDCLLMVTVGFSAAFPMLHAQKRRPTCVRGSLTWNETLSDANRVSSQAASKFDEPPRLPRNPYSVSAVSVCTRES